MLKIIIETLLIVVGYSCFLYFTAILFNYCIKNSFYNKKPYENFLFIKKTFFYSMSVLTIVSVIVLSVTLPLFIAITLDKDIHYTTQPEQQNLTKNNIFSYIKGATTLPP